MTIIIIKTPKALRLLKAHFLSSFCHFSKASRLFKPISSVRGSLVPAAFKGCSLLKPNNLKDDQIQSGKLFQYQYSLYFYVL